MSTNIKECPGTRMGKAFGRTAPIEYQKNEYHTLIWAAYKCGWIAENGISLILDISEDPGDSIEGSIQGAWLMLESHIIDKIEAK